MRMRKQVLRDGNSHKIRFTVEDMRNYGFEEGDFLDGIEFIVLKCNQIPIMKGGAKDGRKPAAN